MVIESDDEGAFLELCFFETRDEWCKVANMSVYVRDKNNSVFI